MKNPLIAIMMGSKNDHSIMKGAAEILDEFEIGYESVVLSAHRAPDETLRYIENAKSKGIEVIIAGAGGAAHLPGMAAAKTSLPVIGVPINASPLNGLDALLSIVQMPSGIPVATVGINNSKNAALLAIRILSGKYSDIQKKLDKFIDNQRQKILDTKLD